MTTQTQARGNFEVGGNWQSDLNISGILDDLRCNRRDDVLQPLRQACRQGTPLPTAVREYFRDRDMIRNGIFHKDVLEWVATEGVGRNLTNKRPISAAASNPPRIGFRPDLLDGDPASIGEVEFDQLNFEETTLAKAASSQADAITPDSGLCDRMPLDQPIELGKGFTRTRTSSGYLEFRNSAGEITARYQI